MSINSDIRTAAVEAADGLHSITTREPEAPAPSLIVKRDDCPEWVADAIREAHDVRGLMPDDLTYYMASAALDAIAETVTGDPGGDAGEYAESAVPVYTHDHLAYIASDSSRREAADRALADEGAADIGTAAVFAWYEEARDVYAIMRAACEDHAGVEA